jgi:hypothetical protein
MPTQHKISHCCSVKQYSFSFVKARPNPPVQRLHRLSLTGLAQLVVRGTRLGLDRLRCESYVSDYIGCVVWWRAKRHQRVITNAKLDLLRLKAPIFRRLPTVRRRSTHLFFSGSVVLLNSSNFNNYISITWRRLASSLPVGEQDQNLPFRTEAPKFHLN